MIRYKKAGSVFLLSISLLLSAGCAVRREVDSVSLFEEGESSRQETAAVYKIARRTDVKMGAIIELLLGMTFEEAQVYEPMYSKYYEVDGFALRMGAVEGSQEISGDTSIAHVSWSDNNEGRWTCYDWVVNGKVWEGLTYNTLRCVFPQDELDTCSTESAIETCQPYADVLGFGNSKASVYAATLDMIEEQATSMLGMGWADEFYSGAPWPEYEVVTDKQITKLREEGKDDEADKLIEYSASVPRMQLPWEKKHEALIVVYQPYLDGNLMADHYSSLYMIYVPYYGHVIHFECMPPYEVVDVLEERTLISQNEAVEGVILTKGYESVEQMNIESISLVYAPQITLEGEEILEKAVPCWKVEYVDLEGRKEAVMIDAIYGDLYDESP